MSARTRKRLNLYLPDDADAVMKAVWHGAIDADMTLNDWIFHVLRAHHGLPQPGTSKLALKKKRT